MKLVNTTTAGRAMTLGLCLSAGLALSQPLTAGDKVIKEIAPPQADEKESCFIDPIWDLATIVDNKDADVLQYFGFNGRYTGVYHWLDSNEGNDEDWENRRQRLGFEATLFHDFDVFASFNLNFNEGDFFQDIDELYVKWKPSKEFNLAVGRIKPVITPEYRLSDRYNLIVERSQLVSQVVPENLWGVVASGDVKGFLYDFGVYSGAGDADDYLLPEDDGGFAVFASAGYDFKEGGIVRAEYFYQDGDEGNNLVKPFDNVYSLSYEGAFLDKKLGLTANAIYGEGQSADRGDVWGFILIPSYYLTKQLQVVGRYTFADGDSDDALSLQSRYEREAPDLVSARAGQYQSFYGGLNYYICGERLKLTTGVEYTMAERDTHDFDAWTVFSAVRLYFGKGKR